MRPRTSSLPPAVRATIDLAFDVEFSEIRVLVDGRAERSEADDESENGAP